MSKETLTRLMHSPRKLNDVPYSGGNLHKRGSLESGHESKLVTNVVALILRSSGGCYLSLNRKRRRSARSLDACAVGGCASGGVFQAAPLFLTSQLSAILLRRRVGRGMSRNVGKDFLDWFGESMPSSARPPHLGGNGKKDRSSPRLISSSINGGPGMNTDKVHSSFCERGNRIVCNRVNPARDWLRLRA